MKTINVTFEDEEFTRLEQRKGNDNWRNAIIKWSLEVANQEYDGDVKALQEEINKQ